MKLKEVPKDSGGSIVKATILLFVLSPLLFVGCENVAAPDFVPPAPPSGLYTETGDNFIELLWNVNFEADVAGYNVFASATYNGRYELIGSTHSPHFNDTGARNGSTYYYAVTAYDYNGNESDLSRDVVYDVPRPEGYNIILTNYRQAPSNAGYDFSEYTVRAFNDHYTDMYFEYYNGEYYMNVATDTDIQDVGPTSSLLELRQAPTAGWSSTHDVRLRVGHTYVVWTWDDHYAKFRVTGLSSGRVVFDWAYQLQVSNPMLRPIAKGGGGRQTVVAVVEH
ncbi:MAG TPA: hypothetical protein DGH68_09180 [Bacteroidetes bacterium]|nr:hypothetical protein [Bacteroidota bacterium]